MNEFQMITEVLYHIPDANVYASTSGKTESRLCGITTFKIMPDMAELKLQMISSGRNQSEYTRSPYRPDRNAISETQIFLSHKYGLQRVLVSNFKSCYVFKKVNQNWAPTCELFLKNNTIPITDLEECWFVFLAYCGYPKAFYDKTSCYSNKNQQVTAKP
uniref:Putative secreted protein n=1 Tax=Ixodes ricinus TaxID=34613 RepID=A0A0K8R386_IXORI